MQPLPSSPSLPLSPSARLILILALALVAALASAKPSSSSVSPTHVPNTSELGHQQQHHQQHHRKPATAASARARYHPLPDLIRDFRFNAPAQPASSSSSAIPASKDGNGQDEDEEKKKKDQKKQQQDRYTEPSVDDLLLSPIVLAVTVDGQVHALKRDSGQWLWTLHDDGGAALGGNLKEEQARRSRAGGAVGEPLVRASGRKKSAAAAAAAAAGSGSGRTLVEPTSSAVLLVEDDGDEEEEEEVYVIEPSAQGDIYLYTRDSSPSGGTLQKLPLSMQQLVSMSPFTFPSDLSRAFIGRKETKLVGVDLRTGRLVGVFGSGVGAGWCEWDENTPGKKRNQEACDEEITRRPEDLLYMSRTEYHLSIYSKSSSVPLQTLSYTTYSSSSFDAPLQAQWTRTPDGRYLQPMHDGALLCFMAGAPGLQWMVNFDHPVVSIFDVAIPPDDNLDPGEHAQPLMFEQPHPLPAEGLALNFDSLQTLPEATFIGKVGNDLFAMSRDNFPLVAFAPLNRAEMGAKGIEGLDDGRRGDYDTGLPDEEDGDENLGRDRPLNETGESFCRGAACLIGRHTILPTTPTPGEHSIEGPSERLLIDPAPDSTTTSTVPRPDVSATSPSHSRPAASSVLSALYKPRRLSSNQSAALAVAALTLLGYLTFRKFAAAKSQAAAEEAIKSFGNAFLSVNTRKANEKSLDASLPPTPSGDQDRVEDAGATTEDGGTGTDDLDTPGQSPGLVSSAPGSPVRSRARSSSAAGSGAGSLSQSPLLDSKELPPIPAVLKDANGALGDDGDGDSDGDAKEELAGVEGTPKKKTRRRRGKRPNKKAAALAAAAAANGEAPPIGVTGVVLFPDSEPMDKELGGLTLGEAEVKEEDIEDASASLVSTDPQLIGGLNVSETILGYGSHGTVVLKGEFQGRAVAVKRLLKDFVTIATHEVALLQESDDHPHVIRYYCKEQRDTFLYIALELCPASLFDLIDQPSSFPELVRGLDSKKALRQIASGIRHLHKLKIVHRDIKPQNILVSPSKHGGVRMLISDFGLCKKLDLDESSFQQTVNHAAGSFGYRAPEVLRGQVDPNAGAGGSPSSGTADSRSGNGVGSVGSGIMTDPAMRLTRSIDIFSLGCIFYYVLTGGEHPFGGRYEREMNILRGKVSLERLDGLGEEALEVQDLITRMVATDPRERPSAEAVLLHPFFWNAQKRLLFICDASDRFEIMERDPPAATLVTLEGDAAAVVGDDWQKALDRTLLDNLGKYRKYDGKSVRDLLRVLRNKKHHYQDLPETVRKNLGDLPGGFLTYFTSRFPRLLLHVYDTVATHLSEEAMFASAFRLPDEDS
ncbi:hypothetical protein T439DRAFT_322550 [Meredithblackwellia eburnea MCA 4105]